MNKNNSHNDDTFLAKWLAGEVSDETLKTLVSNEDYISFLKIRKGLEVKKSLDAPLDESFDRIKSRLKPKSSKTKVLPLYIKWISGVAAVALVLFGIFNYFNTASTLIETNFGETKTLVLVDGSQVILNSKSTISYNKKNWENNRVLTLSGEAYFKVAKGKTFTVNTANGSVEVLGTEFNVNSFEDFFDVTCYEGKVKVTTNDSLNHILTPYNTVRKINGNTTQDYLSVDDFPSWTKGETSFKSVPLQYVIDALERQYNIVIDESQIDNTIIYSGAFPHDSLDLALRSIFEALNITYTQNTKNNIRLSRNK